MSLGSRGAWVVPGGAAVVSARVGLAVTGWPLGEWSRAWRERDGAVGWPGRGAGLGGVRCG